MRRWLVFGLVALVFVTGAFLQRIGYRGSAEEEDEPRVPPLEQVRDRAHDFQHKKRWPEAIASYDELLRKSPNDAQALYWRAMAKWSAGHDDEALEDLRATIALEPGNYDANLSADRILSKQRRFDECVDLWNKYLRVVPRDANAFLERGGSHYHRGDYPAAHADATRACEMGEAKGCARAQRLKETVLK